jgi:hypothetical protein
MNSEAFFYALPYLCVTLPMLYVPFNINTVQRMMSVGCPTLGGTKMGDLVKWLGKLVSAHLCSASRLNKN